MTKKDEQPDNGLPFGSNPQRPKGAFIGLTAIYCAWLVFLAAMAAMNCAR